MMEEAQPQPMPGKGFRAILRVILYLIGVLIVTLAVGVAVTPLLFLTVRPEDLMSGMPISLTTLAIIYLPLAPAVIAFTWLFVTKVDRRPFETFGLTVERGWTSKVWLGIGLGIGLPALMFAASYLAGWTKVTGSLMNQQPGHILAVVAASVAAMVGIAIVEETVMRGYVLQTLKWGYDAITALIVSSVFFGALHLFNPGASLAGFLGTAAAGLFLGYCYLATKRLWLPIGVHFGWNFALGPIFGFPVSGVEIPSWIVQEVSGPTIWTGGRFGPEAGLMVYIALLLGALIVKLTARPSAHPTI